MAFKTEMSHRNNIDRFGKASLCENNPSFVHKLTVRVYGFTVYSRIYFLNKPDWKLQSARWNCLEAKTGRLHVQIDTKMHG